MESKGMRPVKVFKTVQLQGMIKAEKVLVGRGLFHAWGVDFQEFQVAGEWVPGNFTVAVVEMANGEIQNIHPTMIQFTDQG